MMTELKILVHNINDVVNRAAFEKELNVYLKMGWSIRDTHQAVSPGTGFLMMTAVLEKEAEEEESTGNSKQEAVKEELAGSSKQEAGKKETESSEKEKTEDSKQGVVEKEEAEGSEQSAVKESEENSEKETSKESGGETVPKGFKIKEKKEGDQEPAGKGKQKAGEEKKE